MKRRHARLIYFSLVFVICAVSDVLSQSQHIPFSLDDVTLLDGVFKNAQQRDLEYMLAMDPDRLLAPYLKEARLPVRKPSYGNWENTGLDGHIGGHYLSALSLMYAATRMPEVNRRLDYMLAELKRCQDKIGSGYLCGTPGGTEMWKEIAAGKIESDTFSLNKKWVPLYNLHKLCAGLRDAYLIGHKSTAKIILLRLTDYIEKVSSGLTDYQIQKMLFSEHGGLNEVFADVAAFTADEKYLRLAKRFSHKDLLDQLARQDDELDGLHANMQIPKVVGYQRISEIGKDDNYANAARFFWETVVTNRSVIIGGNSVREHFNPVNDFSRMITDIEGSETCNTYNMLKLSKHLFETHGDSKYLDFYERGLYNHILSSQHPVRGGFVYYTPMRPRHYRVYSNPEETMWCCVGSGMENHGKYGELIYTHNEDYLFVNLFIASRLRWKARGLVISQQTIFPDEDKTEIVVEAAPVKALWINIRYPHWVKPNQMHVKVNGVAIDTDTDDHSYVKIHRKWKKGDKIDVYLPMKISVEQLPADTTYVGFVRGPVVLASLTDTTDLDNLIGDSNQWRGYRARGPLYPLDSMPVIVQKQHLEELLRPVPGKRQTFTMQDLLNAPRYNNLELIPFYKLHDGRYIIYWKRE